MSKRKILLLALSACMVAILAVGGTLAYFTDVSDVKRNVFTVGDVEIELTEPNWEAEGKEEAEDVYPGEALKKDPTVENTGTNPCFVRVGITGWDCLIKAGLSEQEIAYRTGNIVGTLGENWVKYGDYFYYTKVMASGDITAPVFDYIVIPTDVTNPSEDQDVDYYLDVYAQAVQAQGAKPSFADVQKMTVEEIAEWFDACNPAAPEAL